MNHRVPEVIGSLSIDETHKKLGALHTFMCISATWVMCSERKSILTCQEDEDDEDGGEEGECSGLC